MRVARPIVLNPESRRQLERHARGRSVPVRVAVRSRIVLLAAEGKQNKQIGEELKISTRMTALWRGRFLLRGVEGLLKDAPRPGRRPSIAATMINTSSRRPRKPLRRTQPTGPHAPWRGKWASVRPACDASGTPMGSSPIWFKPSRKVAIRSSRASWKPSSACI